MDIINITCAEIWSDVGFVYVTLPIIINHINNPDCEQSWYSQDGTVIADPSDPQRLIDPVITVSSDRLVTSRCVNLNHEIICDSSGFRLETMFRVRNQTAVTQNSDVLNEASLQHSDQLWWLFALFFIVIVILICFLLRKRIFKEPESSVQMKFKSDDPCSLNESESQRFHV